MNMNEFLHKLATPLSVAQASVKMLKKQVDPVLHADPNALKNFERIERSLDNLISFVKEEQEKIKNSAHEK